jgi:HPt (histidine-containing phosphotransfer) domain-containing protein
MMSLSTPSPAPHEARPTEAVATPSQLDPQALAKLRELDPDGRHGVLVRVLQTFETSLLRLRAALLDASGRDDAAAIGTVAHTLKSSSASVGALALSARCADIENNVRAGQTADLPAQVASLVAEVDRVLVAVRAMLQA